MSQDGHEGPTIISISAGSSHTVVACVSEGANLVVSAGRGEDGQLGHGSADGALSPKVISALTDAGVTAVVCGAEYSVAVSPARGEVFSWGWGDFGRLGHGSAGDVFVPQPIAFFTGRAIKAVACADAHTLAVTADGALYAFGRNHTGQLGLGHTNDMLAPQQVVALKGTVVSAVACGSESSLVATSDGRAWGWGWGRYGNLGNDSTEDKLVPMPVVGTGPGGVHIAKVGCGWRHSLIVSQAGELYVFGWARYHQLGLGDQTDRLTPVPLGALAGRTIVAVAGGWRHSLALDDTGVVHAWGWNRFGQLGLGDTEDRALPEVVPGLSGPVSQLAAGWRHTLAVCRDGDMYAWGRGVSGQLCVGSEEDSLVPVRVTSLCRRGGASKQQLLATASAPGLPYVAPADRYAVVPDAAVPSGPVASPASASAHAAAAYCPPDAGQGEGGAAGAALVPEAPASILEQPDQPAKRQRTKGAEQL